MLLSLQLALSMSTGSGRSWRRQGTIAEGGQTAARRAALESIPALSQPGQLSVVLV